MIILLDRDVSADTSYNFDFDVNYDEALAVIKKASVIGPSVLIKRLHLNYGISRRLIDRFVAEGIVGKYTNEQGVRYKLIETPSIGALN